MLPRILEPELMDTPEEALAYDAMDHEAVNAAFVGDLLAAAAEPCSRGGNAPLDVLDLGTGTAQIPIELCRRCSSARVCAVDAASSMLDAAIINVELAGLRDRIHLACVDAKQLPYRDGRFSIVVSNSIVHHIPEPKDVLQEAVRVTAGGGHIFFRDLLRPPDQETLQDLVGTYVETGDPMQKKMFADSLAAALTLDEIRELVVQLGFSAQSVQRTSDRHWTWSVAK